MKPIKPYSTTGIGSLPHTDPAGAVRLVLETFDIPFWPQLPGLSFRERMISQYADGMPGLVVDSLRETVTVKRSDEEIERFYETATEGAKIAIPETSAAGLYAFIKTLSGRRLPIVKGHITGPLTFTLGLLDAEGRPVYFDEEMREIGLMLLAAKGRWQMDLLGAIGEDVIIFIDEPIMSALGSTTYMGVERAEALRLLRETVGALKAKGAIVGIHSCGRAEWPLLLESGVDILNFDAYGYGDTLAIYPDEVSEFLWRGGILAWGIVPTLDAEALRGATDESMRRVFEERFQRLLKKVPETLLRENIMLTPSCGTGSRTADETAKVFKLLRSLKESLTG